MRILFISWRRVIDRFMSLCWWRVKTIGYGGMMCKIVKSLTVDLPKTMRVGHG